MTTATDNMLKLEMKRTFAASRERVFAAWTDPALITQWFGCHDSKCSGANIELKVGGSYSVNISHEKMGQCKMAGTITEIDPPAKLAFIFAWTGNEEMEQMPETLVTIDLVEVAGGTELTLTHANVPVQEMADSFKGGWTASLDKLASILG
ncbi:SRPBCC family protein [Rubellicoccus peritrichatus]|uniref:SRPBCC family protein n=1 Tax=Rubellicoccus peritrichatus TaxID=3080537 RepID=A0AAQ3LB10_9BACT|nr:SRPBCC family protein [Puniceicoccus sp. CR14]WOO41967.1 SRPBCC family protein [Puniceicoccus sp. CR14]